MTNQLVEAFQAVIQRLKQQHQGARAEFFKAERSPPSALRCISPVPLSRRTDSIILARRRLTPTP
jgi:hypothetical protein